MDRWEILEKIEDMQDNVDNMNFQGSQEAELWLREAVADYVVELVDNLSQHIVINSDKAVIKEVVNIGVNKGDLYL